MARPDSIHPVPLYLPLVDKDTKTSASHLKSEAIAASERVGGCPLARSHQFAEFKCYLAAYSPKKTAQVIVVAA